MKLPPDQVQKLLAIGGKLGPGVQIEASASCKLDGETVVVNATELCFEQQCVDRGFMEPIAEFMFAPPRKFRADFCWPEAMLILECDGGIWTQGRHTRGSGFLRDMEKLNLAAILGYRVIRVTPKEMKSGKVFELLAKILTRRMT